MATEVRAATIKAPAVGIEPTTSGSGNRRASIAPRGLAKVGHGHAGARTQDLRLIGATLYRLSYTTAALQVSRSRGSMEERWTSDPTVAGSSPAAIVFAPISVQHQSPVPPSPLSPLAVAPSLSWLERSNPN